MMNVFKSDINSGPTIDGSYAAGTVLAGLDTVYTQREMSTWHDTDSWRAALQANSSWGDPRQVNFVLRDFEQTSSIIRQ